MSERAKRKATHGIARCRSTRVRGGVREGQWQLMPGLRFTSAEAANEGFAELSGVFEDEIRGGKRHADWSGKIGEFFRIVELPHDKNAWMPIEEPANV